MVYIDHSPIPCRRSNDDKACTEVCVHLASESNGRYHQYARKLRGTVSCPGGRVVVGCHTKTDRVGWDVARSIGPSQNLSIHLRSIDRLVIGIPT